MTTTTSGTVDFSMDVDDILDEALQPLGGEYTSGLEAQKARRTLNLILIQLQNKNIPLHKLGFIVQPLTEDVSSYVLDTSVVDVLECSINKSTEEHDLPISRYGLREYQQIPDKTQSGRPNLFTTQRNSSGVTSIFWPVPEDGTYTAKLLVSKRVEDVNAAYQKVDLPYRYYPLLVKWLSYQLSLHKQGVPEEIRQRLKNEWTEAMPDTFDEDRERTDFTVTLGGISAR